jgi:hypothetical protein
MEVGIIQHFQRINGHNGFKISHYIAGPAQFG